MRLNVFALGLIFLKKKVSGINLETALKSKYLLFLEQKIVFQLKNYSICFCMLDSHCTSPELPPAGSNLKLFNWDGNPVALGGVILSDQEY